MLVGMDLEGIEALAASMRSWSDELRWRYRDTLAACGDVGRPLPGPIHALTRVADDLVADAADLQRRAGVFADAQELGLTRLSLSLTLQAYTSPRLDPSRPLPEAPSIAELGAHIAQLRADGAASSDDITELCTLLALLTWSEASTERRSLQDELARLTPGIPTPEWYARRRNDIETRLLELMITELRQEELLLFLDAGFQCPPDWEHQARHDDIQIQLAYLEWELSTRPRHDLDHATVAAAVRTLRGILDEGSNGDVDRDGLLTIRETIDALDPAEFDAVVAGLSDDELDTWIAELDGTRGGSFNDEEEAALFRAIAELGNATSVWRIMWADGGDKADPISEKLWTYGDVHDHMSFVELTSANLEAQPAALPTALVLLADMDQPHQMAVMANVAESGHLDLLIERVQAFEESLQPQRSRFGPVGDFLGGAWDAVWGSVTGLWGLTFQVVYDVDGWKEHWGAVGSSFQLLFTSPGDFLYHVADIDTLRDNPARWAGGLVPDVAATLFTGGAATAAAKSGRLGARLARIADGLDGLATRLGSRLETIVTNPRMRRIIEGLSDETGAIDFGGGPRLPVGISAAHLDEMSTLVREATDHIEGEALIHGSRAAGTAGPTSDIDIAILVDEAEFDRLVAERLGTPNPGSARERTLAHALETGKIQSGEAGLRALRRQLEELLNMDVDISIIRRGGAFDRGPYLPLPGGQP